MATGTTEAWVVDSARRIVKRRGGLIDRNPIMQGRGRAGRSDMTACYRGRYLAFECKAPRGPRGGRKHPLSERQALYLRQVNEAGGIGILLDDPGRLVMLLDVIDAGGSIGVDENFDPHPMNALTDAHPNGKYGRIGRLLYVHTIRSHP